MPTYLCGKSLRSQLKAKILQFELSCHKGLMELWSSGDREMLHQISQQFGTFVVTSALVSSFVLLNSKAEAQISHPQLQAKCPKTEILRSQQKQISRIHMVQESAKLMELGVPQRRVSAGIR
ncbi:MAG: hypothetical protein PUP92_40240 [Rhizonema sp. PD38]|nr:hypothetical protein [Rhizonema sp. PD38]